MIDNHYTFFLNEIKYSTNLILKTFVFNLQIIIKTKTNEK